MFPTRRLILGTITRLFCTRRSLLLENLVLRQQLAVFERRHPRLSLNLLDKLFPVAARQVWSDSKQSLIIVLPDTVVQWHQAGFPLYSRTLSKMHWQPIGKGQISKEIRDLIFRMVAKNPTWGAPRIHGELLMLGFDVSELTISRWMRKAPREKRKDGNKEAAVAQMTKQGLLFILDRETEVPVFGVEERPAPASNEHDP